MTWQDFIFHKLFTQEAKNTKTLGCSSLEKHVRCIQTNIILQ